MSGVAHIEQRRQAAAEFREGVEPIGAEGGGESQQRIDDGNVLGLDVEDEQNQEFRVAVQDADGEDGFAVIDPLKMAGLGCLRVEAAAHSPG